ncbi:MAG: methyltransferase domain-containing protein [Clostridia bacterium]|nr:methyltransferase domain-containing protein [Clostridia bacterium]
MNIQNIGNYIQTLRKQKGLSQRELAEALSVTFQAVSKWENGENLPDASIWLDLASILDTTTDRILSSGFLTTRQNRRVNVANLKDGIYAIEQMKIYFGEESLFYKGAVEGISSKMNIPIENHLNHAAGREFLLSEAVIQCLLNGYYMDENDVYDHFTSEAIIKKINKTRFDCGLFASQAQNYRDYRPAYPKAAVNLIFSICPNPVIADLGSGTGKLSELLADRAKRLYAIEPNKQMRRYAEEKLGGFPRFESVPASAEQTTLADASVDIITAAEAFHWFDNERTYREMRRILTKDGYVFLLWNVFEGNLFDEELQRIKQTYRGKKGQKASHISYEKRAENLFGANGYHFQTFDNSFLQSMEEMRGGMLSTSFAPEKGSKDYAPFLADVDRLFHQYARDGELKTTVKTICYWGQLK